MSATAPPAECLRLEAIHKRFGKFVALRSIDLSVRQGELVCFLGPSGCGKTTVLRIVAGLERQTGGRVIQNGRDISALPPIARDYGIVFQSYALFPNLTIAENVGYGLVNRREARGRIRARVAELLELVGLPDSAGKYPNQLSGGQQQRIALARALATSPGLLLLDEPLSALDAKERERLRHEIRALQQRLAVTTVMVTHDQEEALSMADRIVVMNHGGIEQIGTPQEIYRQPASPFVAQFVGKVNRLAGIHLGGGACEIGSARLAAPRCDGRFEPGAPVLLYVRPEDVSALDVGPDAPNALPARIVTIEFLGAFCRAELAVPALGERTIIADVPVHELDQRRWAKGMALTVALPPDRVHTFAPERA